ncbi:hypothetical protein [Comamonas sp. wu1-DMT]|uniref:hypothetical protein n=1 Tax=Comamonas sp. wu1-DMT TaxID=3126390 RepID=UPI0032E44E2E
MRNIIQVLFLFVLSFCSTAFSAEQCETPFSQIGGQYYYGEMAICNASGARYNPKWSATRAQISGSKIVCYGSSKQGDGSTVEAVMAYVDFSIAPCPVCPAGQYFDKAKGQCTQDKCSALAAFCAAAKGSQHSYATYDGDAATSCYQPPDDLFWHEPKFPGCSQGCMANAGPSTGVTDSTGKTLYKGMGTLTGGKCSYGTPSEPSAPDAPPPAEKAEPIDKRCAGQTGTVNGDTVCIPAASATGVDWTGTTKNSDGTSTEGKTTTTCSNGVCESTTTKTTKDASGNVTGTTTSTDKVSQDQYCAKAKNKDGMLCAAVNANPVPGKDSQSGTGSGTGSGNGNGDGDGCTIKDCGSDTGGGPGKAGLPGTGAGEFGNLYEPKYPQGPVEVWKQSSAGIKNSGLGSLAMALMPKIGDGGSAPVWIVDFNFWPLGDMGTHDISPPLWLWAALMSITILTALVTARRLIFGG